MDYPDTTGSAAAAISALRRGSIVRAERLARRALKASPDDPALLDVWWRCLAAQERYGEAAQCLERLLAGGDGDAGRALELGKLWRLGGDLPAAEAAFRRALDLRPGDLDTALHLARILKERGNDPEAREVVAAAANDEGDPRALCRAAEFLEGVEALDVAARLLERALASSPGDAEALGLYARVRETAGDFEAARDHYRRALEVARDFPGAWLRLTWLKQVTDPEDADLASLRAAAEDEGLSVDSRACAQFALGKALDDLGEYEAAFERFDRGNRLWRMLRSWSPDAWAREVEALIQAFPAVEAVAAPRAGAPVPIFIVGMLRTGSTLLERLLSRHSRVVPRGELTELPRLLRAIPAPSYPAAFAGLDGSAKQRIRETYLSRLARGEQGAAAFTDKMPGNFKHLGAIAALFPEAVIVHTRRDPRDTGLSLFRQPLVSPDSAYASDPEAIVHYYRGYRRLMAHWRSRLGDRILDVDYEALVSDPEPVLRRILEAAGLDWEEGVLDSAREQGGIRTASVWQARQPLHRRSVGRWRDYEPMAPDFFRSLADLG